MTSIYKPTRVDASVKRIKCQYWRIAYIDEIGIRKTKRGYKDKSATLAMAKTIETGIEQREIVWQCPPLPPVNFWKIDENCVDNEPKQCDKDQ